MCEAQVALIHLGGHEIGYVILIQSRLQVRRVLCGDFGLFCCTGHDGLLPVQRIPVAVGFIVFVSHHVCCDNKKFA